MILEVFAVPESIVVLRSSPEVSPTEVTLLIIGVAIRDEFFEVSCSRNCPGINKKMEENV